MGLRSGGASLRRRPRAQSGQSPGPVPMFTQTSHVDLRLRKRPAPPIRSPATWAVSSTPRPRARRRWPANEGPGLRSGCSVSCSRVTAPGPGSSPEWRRGSGPAASSHRRFLGDLERLCPCLARHPDRHGNRPVRVVGHRAQHRAGLALAGSQHHEVGQEQAAELSAQAVGGCLRPDLVRLGASGEHESDGGENDGQGPSPQSLPGTTRHRALPAHRLVRSNGSEAMCTDAPPPWLRIRGSGQLQPNIARRAAQPSRAPPDAVRRTHRVGRARVRRAGISSRGDLGRG